MGMFDSIYIDIKCPYCGKESEVECQTKTLSCELKIYHKGDNIGTSQFKYLDTIADCHSPECTAFTNKEYGYVSGFGRMFDVNVFIENGIITGKYEITTPVITQ